jgi:hypothetical protein
MAAKPRREKRTGVSALRSTPLTSLPKHKTCLQPRFGRVFTNVSSHGVEVLRTADEPIEVVGLPEGIQGAETRFVDSTARNAFPALQRVGQRFAIAEREEHVDVIGHDDVVPEVVAPAVEVMETVGDDWGEAWITQGAGAVRGVELVGERAVVAGFGEVRHGGGFAARKASRLVRRSFTGRRSTKPVVEELPR